MSSENNTFSIDLPGDLSDTEIESVLPTFIWINERQRENSKISVAEQVRVMGWRKSKLENGEWLVRSDWSIHQ